MTLTKRWITKITKAMSVCLMTLSMTLLLCLSPVNGQTSASISRLSVSKNASFLLSYFQLQNGITPEVAQALNSGVSVRFHYIIELIEPKLLLNHSVAQVELSRTVSYDAIRQEYLIYLGADQPRAISVKGNDEMEKLIFQVNAIKIAPISVLTSGTEYRLKARVSVEKVNMRLPFSNMMETFSRWGYQTDWHEISFKY